MAKKVRLALTSKEVDVLYKIAEKSGMDIWFAIEGLTEKDGTKSDWVLDCENNRHVTLRYGVGLLQEGMSFYSDYDMDEKEIKVFERLIAKLGLKLDKTLRNTPPIDN
jgi:hypothetical protein